MHDVEIFSDGRKTMESTTHENDYTDKIVATDMIDHSEWICKIQSRQKHQTDGSQQTIRPKDRTNRGASRNPHPAAIGFEGMFPHKMAGVPGLKSILGLSACGLALFWWLSANCASCMGTTLTAT